jgi:inhibitor of KinA
MIAPIPSPLGDRALVLQFGNRIDPELNRQLTAFAMHLAQNPFPGFVEAVPCYASLVVHYDLAGFESVASVVLERWAARPAVELLPAARIARIPVRYDGPDLEAVAERSGLGVDTVIRLHSSRSYRVYMMGFLPGFAYLGELDERIVAVRRGTPRERVEAGSVAVAGRQTGVYPLASAGGWQIIGHTSLQLFDPNAAQPTLLQTGDEVWFEAIP